MHRGTMLIYVVYGMFFLCLNTDFVGSTNTIKNICLILSTIYIFIPVSGCVGRGPSALLCLGAYNAVKMALLPPLRKLFVYHPYIAFRYWGTSLTTVLPLPSGSGLFIRKLLCDHAPCKSGELWLWWTFLCWGEGVCCSTGSFDSTCCCRTRVTNCWPELVPCGSSVCWYLICFGLFTDFWNVIIKIYLYIYD